jgi:predicted dehydrogenase
MTAPADASREPNGTPLHFGIVGNDRTATHLMELVRLRPDFCAPTVPGTIDDPNRSCDIVAVCGPLASRHATAAALLEAGRSVVSPPPVCATRDEAESLWRTAEAAGSRLGVLRLDGGDDFFRAAAEARSGRLGPIRTVRRFVASAGCRDEQTPDVFGEFGPTDLSQLLDIVADEPARVFAVATPRMGSEHEIGGYALTIRFRGGAVANIGRSVHSVTPEDGSWSVSGSEGGYAGGVRWQRGEDDEIFPLADSPAPRFDPLEGIAATVRAEPEVLREQWRRAVWTVALLNASRRSLESGCDEAV